MYKTRQAESCTTSKISVEKSEGWDSAIADAKERIKRLRFSIKIFEQHQKRGEPWPLSSDEAATQN
jgi:hypothetical protein